MLRLLLLLLRRVLLVEPVLRAVLLLLRHRGLLVVRVGRVPGVPAHLLLRDLGVVPLRLRGGRDVFVL